jgi:hypothetical protein
MEMEAFAWYWEHLLPAVGGAKAHWSPSIRHHFTISKAHLPNEPNKLCIPVSSEAFIVLVYEGCLPKWRAMHNWQVANPGKKFNKEKEEHKKAICRSKYFDTDTGQKMFGGAPPATLIRFNKQKELIKKGRNSKKTAKLEEKCLVMLQQEHLGQQQEDEDEEDGGSGNKKAKKKTIPVPEAIKTFGDEE